MKKLIPALCMLLVAACLMGTSTYAWFAAGTTVEATGMAIEATSSGGLAITTSATKNNKTLAASDFKKSEVAVNAATGAWNNGATKVAPTSSGNGEAWYTATGKDINDGAAKDAYANPVTQAITGADVYGSTLFYHAQVYVKTLNTNAVDSKTVTLFVQSLELDMNTNNNDLTKALRVAFKCGSNWVVFAPFRDSAEKHVDGSSAVADGSNYVFGAVKDATDPTLYTASGNATTAALAELSYADTFAAGGYAQVDMFVFFEGEDSACMTQNAINLDSIAVNVTFGADAEATAP